MAGIYVHIPFCKVKCHYCDFHFSIQRKNTKELIDAICQELERRKKFIGDEVVKTIYFGGGTPSIVESELLAKILFTIHNQYTVSDSCEFTLECNPDDLNEQKLIEYKNLGFNRLSIGIQSFNDEVLHYMNRAHTRENAIEAVQTAKNIGFDNITIDLIYGVPNQTLKDWEKELEMMRSLAIPHLSAYCLTIEDGTVFGNWQKNGKLIQPADRDSLAQFQLLIDFMQANNYEQYEISNFATPGYISKHNSAYWLGEKYLGVGPSAHSYDGNERGWNLANNPLYIKNINTNQSIYTSEQLTSAEKYNDYILTRLRTKWGINLLDLEEIAPAFIQSTQVRIAEHIQAGDLRQKGSMVYLTSQGKYVADGISADLFADTDTI